jgi:hypothetical protein
MIYKSITAFFVFLTAISAHVFAQYPGTNPRQQEEINRRQVERELAEKRQRLDNLQRDNRQNRTIVRRPLPIVNEKELRDKFAAPDKADLNSYKNFLKQPKTGIFRLFSDHDCLYGGVVRADGECENTFPGTWFYSFREKDYSDNIRFDLQLKDGKLITDGFLSLGILAKLGSFSLDKISPETKGMKFITDFKPAENAAEIKKQYDDIGRGIEAEGFRYARESAAEIGKVYLMRVVAYRLQDKFVNKLPNNSANLKFILLERDDRKDVTIAFRVIRKEADGNLTIIWKELAGKRSPEIIFSE